MSQGTDDDEPTVMSAARLTPSHSGYIAQTVYDHQSMTERPTAEADAELIAHAPEDLADLLMEIGLLRARIQEIADDAYNAMVERDLRS